VYGKDYVDLGYRAGGENAIAAFAQDMKRTFPVDLKGNRTSEMQVLAGIAGVKDVSMVISMAGGTPGPAEWIRQAYQPYGTTVAGIVTTVMVPPNLAYVQSKQMIALLYGLRGAAEYELLIGRPGNGLAGMGSQSAAAVFILAAVIVGNVRRVKREH
jgi:hypothetical protein